jgi:hypothetical protein
MEVVSLETHRFQNKDVRKDTWMTLVLANATDEGETVSNALTASIINAPASTWKAQDHGQTQHGAHSLLPSLPRPNSKTT